MLSYKNSYKFYQKLFEQALLEGNVKFIIKRKQWVMQIISDDNAFHFQFLKDFSEEWVNVASIAIVNDTHTTLLTVNTDYQGIIGNCQGLINYMMKNIHHNGSKWFID
jgi:hypothetical protein